MAIIYTDAKFNISRADAKFNISKTSAKLNISSPVVTIPSQSVGIGDWIIGSTFIIQ